VAITILTPANLDDVRNNLAGDYVLGADIDLLGYANWVPIGTTAAPFTGKLDGSPYTISNLTIDRASTDNVGLFGVCQFNVLTDAPNLKNISIVDADITGQDNVGILAGKITTTQYTTNGFSLVESCSSTGTVIGRTNVGGLVGYAEGVEAGVTYGDEDYYNIGRIVSSYSLAAVTGSGENIGGLVGYLKYLKVFQSHATGIIAGGDIVGGLVGYHYDCSSEFSYATGDISGDKCIGGLIGYAANRPLLRKSYAEGDVTGTEIITEPEIWNTSLIGVGGLVGFMDFELIDRCYALGDVVGIYRAGGLIGAGMGGGYRSPNIANSFAHGNVIATGQAGGVIGYAFPSSISFKNVYCTGSVTADFRRGAIIGYRGAPYFPNDPIGTITYETPAYYNSDANTAQTTNGGEGKTANELGIETTFQEDWPSFGFYFVIDQDESLYPILKIFYDPLGIVISAVKGTTAQGLVCAYTVDGITYYRKFDGASWVAAVEITELPDGTDTLNAFKTNDNRIGFVADVDGAMSWALTGQDNLTIAYTKTLPPGTCGNLIQTAEDVPKLYYVNAVQSMSKSEATFSGDWGEIAFNSVTNMASDSYISRLKAKYFDGKTWLAWRSRGQHRIFYQNEAADEEEPLKLASGSITIRQDTPVVSVSLEVDSFDRPSDGGVNSGASYPALRWESETITHETEIPTDYVGIYTASDLNAVRSNLSANYIVMANTDLSGYPNWTPINNFTGIFNSNNYDIANLISSGENNVGLFGSATGATFKNINLVNISITATDSNAAALVAVLYGNCAFENCKSNGVIVGAYNVGGLVGNVESNAIINMTSCGSDATISGAYNVGGLVGEIYRCTVNLQKCKYSGSITGDYNTGGMIGDIYRAVSIISNNCYVMENVVGLYNTGGFFGNLYNSPTVISEGYVAAVLPASNSGVLLGYSSGSAVTVDSCYHDSQVVGDVEDNNSTPKTTAEMMRQNTFIGWDFYGTWIIGEYIPNYPPASKIKLNFKAGDSDPLLMGIFYVDRTSFAVGRANVSVDARNSVGKYLKDQTFDERNIYAKQQIQLLLAQILASAGITNYYVDPETTELGMEFSPNQDILSGIDDVLTTVRDWMIREEPDGKVVVAERTDAAFTQPGTYTFYRNRDVFSRSVTKDDNNTYGRVCVHTSDFSVKAYRPVSSSLGWLPPAQKTLYQQCPDGTTSIQAAALAVEIAEQLSNSGEVEEFVGPIRPQVMPGDAAQIVDEDGPNLLGTITTVTHRFGKDGFYTQFTVDSGGKINKPLLSDYLKQISAGTVKSKILS